MQVATHMASTPQLGGPVACPICGLIAVDRIFRDFSMTVKSPLEEKTVSGLAAYICRVNGHVFFVRFADLPGPVLP
jgi:hypothetical protein